MKYLLTLLILCISTATVSAQSNDLIKELESRRGTLQKQIKESESLLGTTQKNVRGQLNSLATLTGQIEERKRYIALINADILSINNEIASLEKQLAKLEADLADKKKKYEASVLYLRKNKTVEERLLFIFSAQTFAQTYRRLRYVNEYATYQRLQGEEILQKRKEVEQKKVQVEKTKKAKENLLKEREQEHKRLLEQEKQQKTIVASLQKRQKGLQDELAKKRREAKQLNTRIDKLIAEELERARKLAEAEAKKEKATSGAKSTTATTKKAEPAGVFKLSKADRELSGSFTSNRGKLPIPVTGAYTIVSQYGQYNVAGLRNVKLDNKGIDIQARPGAEARAIFDGEVSTVFQFQGQYNILIRHGNYISVYCNLSNTSVKKGDKVKTRQSLGKIFSDSGDNNRTVLHFQLRNEKDQLNPMRWIEQ